MISDEKEKKKQILVATVQVSGQVVEQEITKQQHTHTRTYAPRARAHTHTHTHTHTQTTTTTTNNNRNTQKHSADFGTLSTRNITNQTAFMATKSTTANRDKLVSIKFTISSDMSVGKGQCTASYFPAQEFELAIKTTTTKNSFQQ